METGGPQLCPDPILKEKVGLIFSAVGMAKNASDFKAMREVVGSGGIVESLGNPMTTAEVERKLDRGVDLGFVETGPPVVRAPGVLDSGPDVFGVRMDPIEGVEFAAGGDKFELIGKLDADANFIIPALGIGESEVKDPFSLILEGAIDRAVTIHEERGADVFFIGIPPIDGTGRFTGTAIGWRAGCPTLSPVPDDVFLRLLLRVPLPRTKWIIDESQGCGSRTIPGKPAARIAQWPPGPSFSCALQKPNSFLVSMTMGGPQM